MLGTQIISKGLDFDNVDLVGVINADSELYFSDFRASEKAFQILTQVSGRCGRGDKRGLAIIQTNSIDNKVIQYAAKQDYNSFYLEEMKYRKQLNYPPFSFISSFIISGFNKDALYKYCMFIKDSIYEMDENKELVVLGPTEPFLSSKSNSFKYRFILKYKNKDYAYKILNQIKDLIVVSKFNVKFDTNPYQNL